MVFDTMNVQNIYQGRYVSIFISLPFWKLLSSPKRHPRSLRGRWWFLRGVLMFFYIPKTTRAIPSGIIYSWQAYELEKAKGLKVSESVSQ